MWFFKKKVSGAGVIDMFHSLLINDEFNIDIPKIDNNTFILNDYEKKIILLSIFRKKIDELKLGEDMIWKLIIIFLKNRRVKKQRENYDITTEMINIFEKTKKINEFFSVQNQNDKDWLKKQLSTDITFITKKELSVNERMSLLTFYIENEKNINDFLKSFLNEFKIIKTN